VGLVAALLAMEILLTISVSIGWRARAMLRTEAYLATRFGAAHEGYRKRARLGLSDFGVALTRPGFTTEPLADRLLVRSLLLVPDCSVNRPTKTKSSGARRLFWIGRG